MISMICIPSRPFIKKYCFILIFILLPAYVHLCTYKQVYRSFFLKTRRFFSSLTSLSVVMIIDLCVAYERAAFICYLLYPLLPSAFLFTSLFDYK